MTKTTAQVPTVQVEVGDDVAREQLQYAREKVTAALRHAPEPILYARVRLRYAGDRAVPRPAVAQVVADCNGRTVRTEFAAPTMHEAVDGLQSRLRRRLERLARDWEELRERRSPTDPGVWRHGDEPSRRPAHFPRPPEQREVVRRKTFELAEATADEAVFDLELHDYDFHLFRDLSGGQDCVVARTPDGYRLSRLEPAVGDPAPGAVAFELDPAPAPVLSVEGAAARLGLVGAPFVFFRDADSGRGCVLYVRYDGHYGLITPVV